MEIGWKAIEGLQCSNFSSAQPFILEQYEGRLASIRQYFLFISFKMQAKCQKLAVKLIKQVKVTQSSLQFVSNLFHSVILSSPNLT